MNLETFRPTERFSDRVDDYDRYRPSYPKELLDYLDQRVGGLRRAHIADVGAGTGIFTGLLLNQGARVTAVEPNAEMRKVCEARFSLNAQFDSSGGSAEATALPDHSVSLITCAQSFHWVDPVRTRTEFSRILAPGGFVALIWNDLDLSAAGVNKDYDRVKVEFGSEEYSKTQKLTDRLDESIPAFFARTGGFEAKYFTNAHAVDEKGLIGRFFSSSYAPKAGDPRREPATQALKEAFARHQTSGIVQMIYKTELFLGK